MAGPREGRDRRGPGGGGPDWSAVELPLPRATAARIIAVGRRPTDADNVGLWLDKLVYRRRQAWTVDAEVRSFALGQLCRRYESRAGAAALARQREMVAALHPETDLRVQVQARVHGRLLVDYGRANAAETSVSFHPIWGVPRIPGSALKGATLAALRDVLPSAEIEAIFGTQDRGAQQRVAGEVVFYDALPIDGKFELALDVLTPHHREYYGGTAAPHEWDSPVPHTFLTVVATTFEFHLGASPRTQRDGRADLKGAERRLRDAKKGLLAALEETGVGAKTAAGYGRFNILQRGKP